MFQVSAASCYQEKEVLKRLIFGGGGAHEMVAAELCDCYSFYCNKKGGLEIHKPNLMRMYWEIHVLVANTKHHGRKHFCVSVPQFHNFILKNLQRLSVNIPK